MNKRWYPVAFSMTIIGCGGDVDDGKPAATGGAPNYYYGARYHIGRHHQRGRRQANGDWRGNAHSTLWYRADDYGRTRHGHRRCQFTPTGGSSPIDAAHASDRRLSSIPLYLANLRLPPKDATGERYYAHAFDPRPQRDPT